MATKTIGELFARLPAPRHIVRRSWAAVHLADNALFLRVWSDEQWWEEEKVYRRLTDFAYHNNHPGDNGWNERWRDGKASCRRTERTAPVVQPILS